MPFASLNKCHRWLAVMVTCDREVKIGGPIYMPHLASTLANITLCLTQICLPSMPYIPAQFPDLPAPAAEHGPWRQNVLKAYGIISEAFLRAKQLFRQEDGDALRLRIHSEKIMQ
jgi:hypothetical protein